MVSALERRKVWERNLGAGSTVRAGGRQWAGETGLRKADRPRKTPQTSAHAGKEMAGLGDGNTLSLE